MTNSKNYFSFSSNVQNLLFENVSVSSAEGMFGLCIGIAIFTFLYEGVKTLRHYLVILQMRRDEFSTSNSTNERRGIFSLLNSSHQSTLRRLKFHFLQTICYMLQLVMGYMIMLIIMSYNAWFLITVLLTTALCFYFHEYLLSRKSVVLPIEVPASDL